MTLRTDHRAIASRIQDNARVLDIGCGDGALLDLLRETKGIHGRGLELSSEAAGMALARGLAVVQGDAETDLEIFPNDGFDVAILSKTIQQMRRPQYVLGQLARIAPDVIVSFRNYGHWQRRLHLLIRGRMPSREPWYEEDVLHPCTASDMISLAQATGLRVQSAASVSNSGVDAFQDRGLATLNWQARDVILHLSRV